MNHLLALRFYALLGALLGALIFAAPARAEAPKLKLLPPASSKTAPAQIAPHSFDTPADAIIKACWRQTEPARTSRVTARRVDGFNRTVECLRKEILKRASGFTPDNKKDFEAALLAFISQSSKTNWLAYNGTCANGCGTQAHVMALTATAQDLERILKAVAAEPQDEDRYQK